MKQTCSSEIRIPRILIAAPGSGSGKTLLTCALLRLLGRKGIRAAAYKCGPDFIDPMFHKKVLGTPSRNLDLYLAGEEGVRRSFAVLGTPSRNLDLYLAGEEGVRRSFAAGCEGARRSFSAGCEDARRSFAAECEGAQIAIIEGVMGYFDGTGASGMEGSSYHLASVLQAPVLLAADVRGMSRSAAALIKGFADYGEQKMIRGAFLNRVSPAMADRISGWLKSEAAIPVLGSLPADETLHIESRHLGLVEPDEIPDLLQKIDRAADLLEQTLNLELLLEIAKGAPVLRVEKESVKAPGTVPESDWGLYQRVIGGMLYRRVPGRILRRRVPERMLQRRPHRSLLLWRKTRLFPSTMRTIWNSWRSWERRSCVSRLCMTQAFPKPTDFLLGAAIRN